MVRLRTLAQSLRARLIIGFALVAAFGTIGAFAFSEADRVSANDALEDTSLATQARELAAVLRMPQNGRLAAVDLPVRWRQAYARANAAGFAVLGAGGRVLARSRFLNAPPAALDRRAEAQGRLQMVGSPPTLALVSPGPLGTLVVVERSPPGALDESEPDPLTDLGPYFVLAAVLLLGALLVWAMAELSLRAVRLASIEAEAIGPSTPGARLSLDGLPLEAQPLARAVNGALDRVSHALQAQRRFTADAAHALRTPLAVMDLRLQEGASGACVPLERLRADLADIAQVVRGLLNLAYVEHRDQTPGASTNIARLLREEAAKLEPLLERSGRTLSVEAPPSLPTPWDARALSEMIAALLENALTHGAGSIQARLRARENEREICLEVEDGGSGVPEAEWGVVFERFRKRDVSSPGAGLGLSIVQEAARRFGGVAAFIAPAVVQVRLPVTEGPAPLREGAASPR